MDDPARDLAAVASLADPLRKALYDLVAVARQPVGRDEAASAVGAPRQTVAYHLDRLVDDGLLEVEFRRLTGRTGPGAGRPAKLYRRAQRDHEVSVPPRRYELAARILLGAAEEAGASRGVLEEVARAVGRRLGEGDLEDVLERLGYQATEEAGEVRFRNCPFHALVEQSRETTCGLNLALVQGVLDAVDSVDAGGLEAVLAPEEGYCCVRLRRTSPAV